MSNARIRRKKAKQARQRQYTIGIDWGSKDGDWGVTYTSPSYFKVKVNVKADISAFCPVDTIDDED